MTRAETEIERAILHLEHMVAGDPYVDGALECMRDARRAMVEARVAVDAAQNRLHTARDLLARMPFSVAVVPNSWSDWLKRRRAFLEGE
jgi:hypothetical protein